jgi:hypothetical protein
MGNNAWMSSRYDRNVLKGKCDGQVDDGGFEETHYSLLRSDRL